jgi:ABC-type uncharacterized transport system auxiliary subunit
MTSRRIVRGHRLGLVLTAVAFAVVLSGCGIRPIPTYTPTPQQRCEQDPDECEG